MRQVLADPAASYLGAMNRLAPMMQQGAQEPQSARYNALAAYGGPTKDAAGAAASGNVSAIGGRLVNDLMQDFGLTRAEAAGIVGNLAHESGNFETLQEIDPLVEGSRGGYGFAQWTGPRRRSFEAWAAERGLDPASYEANYGYLAHELTNTPESRVLSRIAGEGNADTATEAARVFSETFLRPGIPHMDSRLSLARLYAG